MLYISVPAIGGRSILAVVRRMKSGGLLMCAPVCSSWVWMSRSVTLRSKILPLGDIRCATVAAGNLQVSRPDVSHQIPNIKCLSSHGSDATQTSTALLYGRLVLLLLFVAHLGGTWVVEQPMTSLMWSRPRFQELFGKMKVPRPSVMLHGLWALIG